MARRRNIYGRLSGRGIKGGQRNIGSSIIHENGPQTVAASINIICPSSIVTLVPGNTKGGSITVLLTSCLTGLESAVWQLTIFVFICKTN
jgi:hypothetical protein